METIKVSQFMLNKVLDHYRDVVIVKFPLRLITPATLVQMEMYLKAYQSQLILRETHPAWAMALKLIFDAKRNLIDVCPDDQANIEVTPS